MKDGEAVDPEDPDERRREQGMEHDLMQAASDERRDSRQAAARACVA